MDKTTVQNPFIILQHTLRVYISSSIGIALDMLLASGCAPVIRILFMSVDNNWYHKRMDY